MALDKLFWHWNLKKIPNGGLLRQTSLFTTFSSYNRQRGSGIGPLAAEIGRTALPFAKKNLLPAAKNIGKELLTQTVPEVLDVIAKRK